MEQVSLYSPWLGRTFYLLLKILCGHENLQVLEVQVFHRSSVMATSKVNIDLISRR
jgi:hypothetical protein